MAPHLLSNSVNFTASMWVLSASLASYRAQIHGLRGQEIYFLLFIPANLKKKMWIPNVIECTYSGATRTWKTCVVNSFDAGETWLRWVHCQASFLFVNYREKCRSKKKLKYQMKGAVPYIYSEQALMLLSGSRAETSRMALHWHHHSNLYSKENKRSAILFEWFKGSDLCDNGWFRVQYLFFSTLLFFNRHARLSAGMYYYKICYNNNHYHYKMSVYTDVLYYVWLIIL